MKIKTGATRVVFVLGDIVIKIPYICSWYSLLWGLCSNIEESRTWKWNSGTYESGKSYLLCPVLWTSWGGWIVIMKKADVDRHKKEVYDKSGFGNIDPEEEVKDRYKEWIEAGFGGDDKCDNYGYLDGKLVKIDYPSTC